MSLQRAAMLFQEVAILHFKMSKGYDNFEKKNFTNEQLSSSFIKSCFFQLSWPAVVPDLDHNLASKCVGCLYIHWKYLS